MSNSAEELIEEDPSYSEAMETVQERLDDTDAIEWTDVEGDISSGQWGRLIQEGVLEETDDGYVFADADDVEAALNSASASLASAGEWTLADKVAAGLVAGMTAGYYVDPIRNIVGGGLNIFLGPIDALLPFYGVLFVVAAVTAVYSTYLQSRLMDTEAINEIQSRMKELQQKQREARKAGDENRLKELRREQKNSASDQITMLKEQFRPTVWIALFTVPVFLWVYWVVQTGQLAGGEQAIIMPLVGRTEWTATIGPLPLQAWIVWYILISLGLGQIIRKVFDVDIGIGAD